LIEVAKVDLARFLTSQKNLHLQRFIFSEFCYESTLQAAQIIFTFDLCETNNVGLGFSSSAYCALKIELAKIKVVKTKLKAGINVPKIPGAEVMSLTNALSRKSRHLAKNRIGISALNPKKDLQPETTSIIRHPSPSSSFAFVRIHV